MKIGILVGRETSFPNAFVEHINGLKAGATADLIKIGGVREIDTCDYRVIIDRISHEVPFYRAFLKTAVLNGVTVINNPFWWSADDKFFGAALVQRLGLAVPRTVLLPQQWYKEDVVSESLRNLEYPLDWRGILDYVGLPAIMKPYDGGGWKNVHKIDSMDELLQYYNQSGTLCMMLQEFIQFDRYVRCYTIGRRKVLIMPYDPTRPYGQNQYIYQDGYLEPELLARIERDCLTLNQALGYDINTAEFAIRDGVPYAIDFTNPAPDADLHSVGPGYHQWFLEAVSELAIESARQAEPASPRRHWAEFLRAVRSRPALGEG
ncbi:MAG: hypothetical protein HY650_05800 [Acidobacteria bacterium]|nr:hypothetical protein [Acidobacteriota bacterium]